MRASELAIQSCKVITLTMMRRRPSTLPSTHVSPRVGVMTRVISALSLVTILSLSLSAYAQDLEVTPPGLRPWCKVTSSERIERSAARFQVTRITYTWDGLSVTLGGDASGTYQVKPSIAMHRYSWSEPLSMHSVLFSPASSDCSLGWCVPTDYELREVVLNEQTNLLSFIYYRGQRRIAFNELGYYLYESQDYGQGASEFDGIGYECTPYSCKPTSHSQEDSEGLVGGRLSSKRIYYMWSGDTARFDYDEYVPSNAYEWDSQPYVGEVTVSPTGQVLKYRKHTHRGGTTQIKYTYDCEEERL